MKRIIYVISVLMITICMTACGKKSEVKVSSESEIAKEHTSYTLEELKNAKFPDGYCMTRYNNEEEVCKICGKYPTNSVFEMLIPELMDSQIDTLQIENSGPEDGMIYTLCQVTMYDGTVSEVLFINDPITSEFVAGSMTFGSYDNYVHYLFYY